MQKNSKNCTKRFLRYFSAFNTTLFVWSKTAKNGQFVFQSQLHFSNFVEERVGNTEKRKKKLTLENTAKIDCEHNAHKSFFRWIFLWLRICFPESISFFIFRYSRPFLRRNLKKEIDSGKQIGHFWPFLAIFGHTKRVVLKALKYLKNRSVQLFLFFCTKKYCCSYLNYCFWVCKSCIFDVFVNIAIRHTLAIAQKTAQKRHFIFKVL